MKILLKNLLPILVAWLFSACLDDKEQGRFEYVGPGDPLPVFTARGANGTLYDSRAAEGKVTLLCLFDKDCKDCRRELPRLQALYAVFEDDTRFESVNIGREHTLEIIAPFWEQMGFTMPYYEDPSRSLYRLFATVTVPRIYLVGPDRHVVRIWKEKIPEGQSQLTEIVYELLNENQ